MVCSQYYNGHTWAVVPFFFILIIYLVKVSVFDSVVQGGDAVWEGLRIYDGKVFKLDEHLDRCNNYFCISILFSACDIWEDCPYVFI